MNSSFHIPYKNHLPPLTTDEFAALKASIENDGLLHPIIVDEDGNVLDGHHRLKIVPDAPTRVVPGLTEAEKRAFLFQTNLARRNLSPAQKKEVRERLKKIAFALRKENPKKNTQERIATKLGVAQQTISDWFRTNTDSGNTSTSHYHSAIPDARVKIPALHKPIIFDRVSTGEPQAQVAADYGVSQKAISNIVRQEAARREAVERREKPASGDADALNVFQGDFREIGKCVKDSSIYLIFTDPPYDHSSIGVYKDLSVFASRVLRPGGLCLAYSAQPFLPVIEERTILRSMLDFIK